MAASPLSPGTPRQYLWPVLIGLSAVLAFVFSWYFLQSGTSTVFPHLFYLPIVLAAYLYPRRGTLVAALLAAGYFAMVLVYLPGDSPATVAALVRAVIFVAIGWVVATLSLRLSREEQRYTRTFRGSGAGVFLVRPADLVILDANEKGAELFAAAPNDLEGRPLPAEWARLFAAEVTDRVAGVEVRYRDVAEKERWALLSASRITEGEMVVTAVEITERKAAEAALAESERVLSTLFSNLPGLAYRCRMDPRYTMEIVSDGVADLTGYPAEDLIGNRTIAYGDLVHPDDREWIWNEVRAAVAEERPFRLIYRIVTRSGEERWVWEQGVGVRPAGTGDRHLEGFIADISEQVHAKEEVDRVNRQLFIINRIIRLSTGATTPVELSKTILTQTLELFGIDGGAVYLTSEDRSEALIQHAQGIGEEHAESLARIPVGRFREGALTLDTLAHFDVPGGGDAASVSVIPFIVQHDLVGGMVLYSRDPGHRFSPDERNNLESIGQEMGSAILEAILQQRLEEANEEANLYIDIMAHDINNANTAAIGYAEFLTEMLEGDARDFARKVLISVRKSVEIIANVSTIRKLRQESPQPVPVPLDPVIRGEIARFPDADIRYAGTDVVVTADDLLSEVVTNLIGNSIKFGGPEVAITIGVTERDGMAVVSVEDDGPGIADADKPHIFSRFVRGQTRKSGKGLGLYITRMLVTRYGGAVWAGDRAEGRPEEGARVCFSLPLADPTAG